MKTKSLELLGRVVWRSRRESVVAEWACSFCGKSGKRTKEHVWPKWLRKSDIYPLMVDAWGMKGERDKREFDEFFFSGGKMITERVSVSVNHWVPELTASVCAACNNGWMSQLEGAVRRFLGGYVLGSQEVMLSGYECLKLAQWSVKTAMTYLAALNRKGGVFTQRELREMSQKQKVPDRCQVWLHSMTAGEQVVACKYEGRYLLDPSGVREGVLRDNLGLFMIGMPRLMIYVGVAPSESMNGLIDLLVPRYFGGQSAPQFWPRGSEPLFLPGAGTPLEYRTGDFFSKLDMLEGGDMQELACMDGESLSKIAADVPVFGQWSNEVAKVLVDVCRASRGEYGLLELVGSLKNPAELSQEVRVDLTESALHLRKERPSGAAAVVARYLYNLAHLMSAAGNPFDALALFLSAAVDEEGGYSRRPDCWEGLGNQAWQVAAFCVAAEAYKKQVELSPSDLKARLHLAEAYLRANDLARSQEVVALSVYCQTGVPVSVQDRLLLLQSSLCCLPRREKVSESVWESLSVEESTQVFSDSWSPEVRWSQSCEELTALLESNVDSEFPAPLLAAVKAYLGRRESDWIQAARLMLSDDPNAPLAHAVVRQGVHRFNEFVSKVLRDFRSAGAELSEEAEEVLEKVQKAPREFHSAVKRFVNDKNEIVG